MHRPSTSRDHRGEELPALACHTGIAGWDPGRLRVTYAPVDCRRCLRLPGGSCSPAPIEALTLFNVA